MGVEVRGVEMRGVGVEVRMGASNGIKKHYIPTMLVGRCVA